MAHSKDGSGLQEHSKGEDYPFTVVGTIKDDLHTGYYIQNLETGITWFRTDPLSTSGVAHQYARILKLHGAGTLINDDEV